MKITIALLFILTLTLSIAAQSDRYLNELEAYRFFGKGKLQGLSAGYSSQEDVIKVFGDDCRKPCEYNDSWTVVFEYYDHLWTMSKGNGSEETKYILDSKYLGHVRAIELRAKKPVALVDFEFPVVFHPSISPIPVDFHNGGGKEYVVDSFRDMFGLSYHAKPKEKYKNGLFNGELTSIRYEPSESTEKTLYVLRK